jgi:hypothetical protein
MIEPDTSSIFTVLEQDPNFPAPYTTVLERTGVPLGGYNDVTTVTSLYPFISTAGVVSIQIGASTAVGNIVWKPAVIFDPTQMKKVDIRSTGSHHAWRFESVGGIPFSMNGFDVEYEHNGRR